MAIVRQRINQAVLAGLTFISMFHIGASATTWTHESTDFSSGHPYEPGTHFSSSWNDSNNNFSMSTTFTYDAMNDPRANGGWFVFTPGNTPTVSNDDAAMFFMDFDNGDLLAYNYHDFANSYDPAQYITTYHNVINVVDNGLDRTITMNFDATMVQNYSNDPQWTGVSFGQEYSTTTSGGSVRNYKDDIGIWLHFYEDHELTYDAQGRIATRNWGRSHGGYELSNGRTTVSNDPDPVSEPAGLAFLGLLGMVGFAAYRRKHA